MPESFYYDGMSIQNRRSSNMDSLLLKERNINDKSAYLAVVCDGVGSLKDGGFAAAMAVEKLEEWFDTVEDTGRLGICFLGRVKEISGSIEILANARSLKTACTLSALLLVEDRYYLVHTGDSRIYCMRSIEEPRQMTTDQASGNKLTACLGRKDRLDLQYDEGANDAWLYLLCSDGLYKKMEPAVFAKALRTAKGGNLRAVMEKLIRHVVDRGENDNISLAILTSRK